MKIGVLELSAIFHTAPEDALGCSRASTKYFESRDGEPVRCGRCAIK